MEKRKGQKREIGKRSTIKKGEKGKRGQWHLGKWIKEESRNKIMAITKMDKREKREQEKLQRGGRKKEKENGEKRKRGKWKSRIWAQREKENRKKGK